MSIPHCTYHIAQTTLYIPHCTHNSPNCTYYKPICKYHIADTKLDIPQVILYIHYTHHIAHTTLHTHKWESLRHHTTPPAQFTGVHRQPNLQTEPMLSLTPSIPVLIGQSGLFQGLCKSGVVSSYPERGQHLYGWNLSGEK